MKKHFYFLICCVVIVCVVLSGCDHDEPQESPKNNIEREKAEGKEEAEELEKSQPDETARQEDRETEVSQDEGHPFQHWRKYVEENRKVHDDSGILEVDAEATKLNIGSPTQTIELFHNEPVSNGLLVSNLKAGNRLNVVLSGTVVAPQLSEVYTKPVSTAWVVEKCSSRCKRNFCKGPKESLLETTCTEIPKQGTCQAEFRDFGGYHKRVFNFSDEELRLRPFVGDQKVSLDEPTEIDPNLFQFTLVITEDMLTKEDSFHLRPPEYKNELSVDTGFIGYGDISQCEGLSERDFRFTEAVSTVPVISHPLEEYRATISIVY